jgi:hypothetical protein
MTIKVPPCQTIKVFAFRGNRTPAFAVAFQKKLDDEKNGGGPGPTMQECQLFAGHAGVSIDQGKTIYGFNPDAAGIPLWELMNRLKYGEGIPGVVRDDISVFVAARLIRLVVISFDISFPDPAFLVFRRRLDAERKTSRYYYAFPNGDGNCNCITWLERLGLPLLTGNMNEFVSMIGPSPSGRRFGLCR